MKKGLYLIVSHNVDTEFASHSLVGTHCSLESAIAHMQEAIYNEFEEIKEWWKEDDEDESVEEQYQEWIEDNYLNDEHTLWSYTDDDPVENIYKILPVEVDTNGGDLYALICTRVDGVENRTDVLGIYHSQQAADEALGVLESDEGNSHYLEVFASVKRLSID